MSTDAVRVALYRFFVEEARAPTTDELVSATGLDSEETRQAMRRLDDDDVIAFHPGTEELWLAHPFCAGDAPFHVENGRHRWEAICIWDAVGILALGEFDGRVTTECPDCGQDLEVGVHGGRIAGPSGAVVHYGVPARHWYEDIAYT
jgi:Alkylmercury lyase